MQASFKKCKIFGWKKRSNDRDCWKRSHRGGEGSHRVVGPEKKREEKKKDIGLIFFTETHEQICSFIFQTSIAPFTPKECSKVHSHRDAITKTWTELNSQEAFFNNGRRYADVII